VRVVRDLECTLTSSLLGLRIIVMRGAIRFEFVYVTRGDTSTSIRSDNASACTQGGGVVVDDIVVRASLWLHCGF